MPFLSKIVNLNETLNFDLSAIKNVDRLFLSVSKHIQKLDLRFYHG